MYWSRKRWVWIIGLAVAHKLYVEVEYPQEGRVFFFSGSPALVKKADTLLGRIITQAIIAAPDTGRVAFYEDVARIVHSMMTGSSYRAKKVDAELTGIMMDLSVPTAEETTYAPSGYSLASLRPSEGRAVASCRQIAPVLLSLMLSLAEASSVLRPRNQGALYRPQA